MLVLPAAKSLCCASLPRQSFVRLGARRTGLLHILIIFLDITVFFLESCCFSLENNMSTFTRSIAPLLRTGRLAIQHRFSVNPVTQVLGRDVSGVRGFAQVFERTKPHVNIGMYVNGRNTVSLLTCTGTIGHVDHGKVHRIVTPPLGQG